MTLNSNTRKGTTFIFNSTIKEYEEASKNENEASKLTMQDLEVKYNRLSVSHDINDTEQEYPARVFGSNLMIGDSDWEKAQNEDLLFVDKIHNLKLMWGKSTTDYLYRHCRTGKTMFLTMADYFFGLVKDKDALEKKRSHFG
ncbi:hypothetical protein H4219_004952, partial [Mycoemilia scoparia]